VLRWQSVAATFQTEIQALGALKFENFVSINAQRNSKLES